MTPRPQFPILAWFQPASNFAALAGMGVNVVVGPELGNPVSTDQAKWSKAAADAGLWVILKNPVVPLPDNCYGFILSVDEPNGKGILPAALAAESARLRALDATKPIVLSLAGDKVTSANFRAADQVQLYKDYAGLADILTVDAYSKNRNAVRYPTTWTGDAVKTLIAVTGKPVWAWIECNDQQLPPIQVGETNREPTPAEIKATVDYAIANGATGIGWFTTCDRGRYGWPGSYLPQVNRIGLSMQPQYDMVKQISLALSPAPQPAPPTPDPIATLTAQIAELVANQRMQADQIGGLTTMIHDLQAARVAQDARIAAAAKALAATQPTTQP